MRSESHDGPQGPGGHGGRRRRREEPPAGEVPPAPPVSGGRRRLRPEPPEPIRQDGEVRMPPPPEGSGGRRRLQAEDEPPAQPRRPRRRHRYAEEPDEATPTPALGMPAPPVEPPTRRVRRPETPPPPPVAPPARRARRAQPPVEQQPPPPMPPPGLPPVPPAPRRQPPRPPVPPPPLADERPTEVIHADQVARYRRETDPELVPEPQYDDRYDESDLAGILNPGDRREDYDDEYEDYAGDELAADELYDEDAEDDDLLDDERAEPERIGDELPEDAPKPKKKRRKAVLIAAVLAIVIVGGAGWYGAQQILGFGYDDFEGAGEGDVLVEVVEGASTNAIAAELTKAGVVASPKAFVEAAEDESKMRSIQPGYYQLKSKMSGTNAVTTLVDPAARKGVLQIRAGTQLNDITQPDNKVTDGVLTLIAKSSCATVNGQSTCVPVEQLRELAENASPADLGVPDWAAEAVNGLEKKHRLEGLIAPGVYDVKPGWDAMELMKQVLKHSTIRLQAAGLPAAAEGTGKSPYELLVIASIIEREGVKQDFGKVSRVIYNRLEQNMRLDMDSTVNYLVDRPVITTTDEDRGREGPYNTYKKKGLPAGPISSPSKDALDAAAKPPPGDILYFVKCEKNGISCFAVTNDEHNANRELARERGAY